MEWHSPAFLAKKRRVLDSKLPFQVLLDFDRTLTKHHGPSGKPCEECHDIIFKHAALGEEFVQDIQKVLSAYDVDHSKMTEQELVAAADWWWSMSHAAMIQHRISHRVIADAVAKADVQAREGAAELLTTLRAAEVPTCIVSAGLSDVIRALCRNLLLPLEELPNVRLHSNAMRFGADGVALGFEALDDGSSAIHWKNKKRTATQIREYFASVRARLGDHHIIVLGDGLGDAAMADELDVPPHCAVLRIGLQNRADPSGELLRSYQQAFDVVLTGDQPLCAVTSLLRELLLPTLLGEVASVQAPQRTSGEQAP